MPTTETYPAELMRLDNLILESRGVGPAGSPEHKAAPLAAYEARGGEWNYDRWSSTYEANQERAKLANAAADSYHQTIGWGAREQTVEITIDGSTEIRRLDIADKGLEKGVEYKTGYQYASADNHGS